MTKTTGWDNTKAAAINNRSNRSVFEKRNVKGGKTTDGEQNLEMVKQ